MLAKKSDMYSGFQQQDAQEFLSVLLDTLHEDLNQGDIKRTFTMPDGDGKCDREVASESWNFHKQRNSSYFVENFMGQYKSKVTCLECSKVSITFDPYMYLSLPLSKGKTPVEYFFLSSSAAGVKRCKVYTNLPVSSHILLKSISQELEISGDKLAMYTISKTLLLNVYTPEDTVTPGDLNDGQLIIQENRHSVEGSVALRVLFSVSHPLPQNNCACCNQTGDLKRCLRCKKVAYCNHECQKKHFKVHKLECKGTPQLVGLPLVIFVKRRDLKLEKLTSLITSTNTNLSFIQQQKAKFRTELKVCDRMGVPLDNFTLSASSKAADFIRVSTENLSLMLVYDNSNSNLLGQTDFEIDDHRSLTYSPPKISLGDCFEMFTQEEKLPSTELWKCPRCNKLQRATKQISLFSCPNYLIVHLKRFQAKNIIMFDKVDKHITFPIRELDLSGYSVPRTDVGQSYYTYDLYGVANHYGSLYRGHYTAFAKLSGEGTTWREFDDRCVTDISDNDVQSQAAYVLFYKRRDFTESISHGVLCSEDDEEECFYDAVSVGNLNNNQHNNKESSEEDDSCYFEAKLSDDEQKGKVDQAGSSSSDVSVDYVKVQRDGDDGGSERSSPLQEIEEEEVISPGDISAEVSPDEVSPNVSTTEDSEGITSLQQIQINFEDQLD
eukprot:sb/3462776/